MNDHALQFERVTRRFGRTIALDGIDLEVAPGTILGLVGRNGAGKTTALRLSQGVLFPDDGRISVLGLDPIADGQEVRTRVGLMAEESALYPWMTVSELLGFAGRLNPRWDPSLAETLRERLDVPPDGKIETLSRGNRAKVALIATVGARPELLLLDDPTAGLDPLVRREVLEGILETVVGDGGAVVYASHLIHDVERIADTVVVLDEGRVALSGGLDSLKGSILRATAVFDGDVRNGRSMPGCIEAVVEGRVLTVVAVGNHADLEAALRARGAREVEITPMALEDILVSILRADDDSDGGAS